MLRLEDVQKSYGDVVALDGCSFEALPGRMLGFLGPNGAGKTTAMRSVFGLVSPDAGRILWDGEPVDDLRRNRFGYMPEQRGLYPKMRIRQQLVWLARAHGMDRAAAGAATDRWLEVLGLADRAEDTVDKLSHGNQQRVQLAAALVHGPDLMVLDEPFSGLDPLGVDTMVAILREMTAEGKTVVFSSHQLELVEDLCDDVAIISRGRVVASGDVQVLKDASPVRRLELEMEGPADAVLAGLPGVRSHEVVRGRHVLTLEASTDVRGVIAAAEDLGTLRHFIYTSPSLSDLFREAVA